MKQTEDKSIQELAELKAKLDGPRDITIPKSLAEEICWYCEDQAIYDKLGKYGDFYYKLKKIIAESEIR